MAELTEEQRCIKEIEDDLKRSIHLPDSLSDGTYSNSIHESATSQSYLINSNNKMDVQECVNIPGDPVYNGNFSTCQKSISIHSSNVNEESKRMFPCIENMTVEEQNREDMIDNNNETTDSTGNDRDVQSSTIDHPHLNDQISVQDFCCRALEKMQLIFHELTSVLNGSFISAEVANSHLDNLQMPLSDKGKLAVGETLNTLSDIFQKAVSKVQPTHEVHNEIAHDGSELNGIDATETSEQRVTEPDEPNNDYMNQQLRVKRHLPTSYISKNTSSSKSVSKLLSYPIGIINGMILVKLKILKQPKSLWKSRSIACLARGECSNIQVEGGRQREPLFITWTDLNNCSFMNLFAHIQLLTYYNEPNLSKALVPSNTTVRKRKISGKTGERNDMKSSANKPRYTLNDLIIDEAYGFNNTTKTILCPFTKKEYKEHKKGLSMKIFNLYKTSEESEAVVDNDEAVGEEAEGALNESAVNEDESIDNQIRKLCKFRIQLCHRTRNGRLESVSECIDTDFIEESKGTEELAINRSCITPSELCECGDQIITVSLNTDSEKAGFIIRLNGEQLDFHKFLGVINKTISFRSVAKITSGRNDLRLTISKKSITKTIKENCDPKNGLQENTLFDEPLTYVKHTTGRHHH